MTMAKKKNPSLTPDPETKDQPSILKKVRKQWAKLTDIAIGEAMEDPFTKVRYTTNPTPIDGEVKVGCWLDCQIKAGLICLVEGPS